MRHFVAAALMLFAIPALAQNAPPVDREPEMDREMEDDTVRFRIERDGPRIVIRGRDGEEAFDLTVPDIASFPEFHALGDGPYAFFGEDARMPRLRGLMSLGASDETRDRMRALQSDVRDAARRARTADGDARREAERELDALLGELFEVRGQARQEEADALRERARELMAEADEKEAALRDRAARREALIEARRAELLGESASDW